MFTNLTENLTNNICNNDNNSNNLYKVRNVEEISNHRCRKSPGGQIQIESVSGY